MISIKEEMLDLLLVPSAILILIVYIVFTSCSDGHDRHGTKVEWVKRIVTVDTREGLAAISSRITETYAMCGACLMIFPTAWLANPSSYVFQRKLVYGNSSPSLVSIKFVILISCFLPASGFFAYSAKQFKETLYLIGSNDERANEAVAIRAFIRGTTFFSLGIRCLLCAGPSLLWFFGPIPMFVSSVALVISLHVAGNRASPQLHVPPENTDESHGDNSNITKEEAYGHPSIDIEMPPPGV